jgi:hypothetical protein
MRSKSLLIASVSVIVMLVIIPGILLVLVN